MNLEDFTPFAPAVFIGDRDRAGHTLTIAVKATLAIAPGGVAKPADEQLWPVGDEYSDDSDPANSPLRRASDLVPHKRRADVLLNATAHRPANTPSGAFAVSVRVASWGKRLVVHGERAWDHGVLSSKIIEGEPLAAVPITYANAFGGPKHEANPAGRGRGDDLLPYVELPEERVSQVGDKPTPGGFGPLSPGWAPRKSMVGTYGDDYLANHWPGKPGDFDPAYYNAAPSDQQIDGFWRGDEEIVLENLHPEFPLLATRLPGWRVVCLSEDREGKKELIPLVIDTLVIEPDAGRIVLTWRGSAPASDPNLPDVKQLGLLVEPIDAPIRSPEDYDAALTELIAERDKEFVPEEPPQEEEPAEQETSAAASAEDRPDEVDLQIERLQAKIAKMRADGGLPPAPDPNTPAPPLPAAAKAEFEKIVAQLDEEDREAAAEADQDEAANKWTRTRVIDAVESKTPFDEADLTGLDLSQLDFSEADFRGATLDRVDFGGSTLNGANLAGCSAADAVLDGALLREAHLEGADLTGATLTAADAAGVFLTKANLSEAKLDRSNLSGAIAVGTQLRKASLTESNWTGANAAGASLAGVSAAGANWTDASLTGADATGGDFAGAVFSAAQLADAGFGEARLVKAVLDGAVATDADFTEADLTGASFVGADLNGAWLSSATADDANFENACCVDLQLDGASAKRAVFKNAEVTEIRGSERADLSRADFAGVRGAGAVFENCLLDGADFSRADLHEASFDHASLKNANLTAADLPGARFDYANCRGAVFVDANLFEANLAGADLSDADITRANLYGVEFIDANITGLRAGGANLRMTKLEQWAANHGR